MTTPLPDVAGISAYLTTHGWREERTLPPAGTMFVFDDKDDGGKAITLFVPASNTLDDYPLRVADVVDTVAAVERRPKDAVWSDLRDSGAGGHRPSPQEECRT